MEISNKAEEEFVRQAGELQKKISNAQAELERLQLKRKITKKGRKNRIFLMQECGTLSAASVVSYIERKKCDLRKLKRSTERRKKVEESRALNLRFESDPREVYSLLDKMVARYDENEKPKYQKYVLTEEKNIGDLFDNITEASTFWKSLWETSGTGNSNCQWFKEIERAMNISVPNPDISKQWELTTECVAKVVRKKRNWSASGPGPPTQEPYKRGLSC